MSEELIHVYRGELIENIHRGDIAVVDYKGKVLNCVGDYNKLTYFRSAAKLFLALNVILCGAADYYGFDDKELAIMCASHRGETYHVETLTSIINKLGLQIDSLMCGITEPFSRSAAISSYKSGQPFNQLHCACSGKHLGMLAICKYKGYPLEGYTETSHPVQQDGSKIVSMFTGVDVDKIIIGVDGCTVPVHGMPLYNMALAYARFANPSEMETKYQLAVERLRNALVKYPEMISGKNSFCTDLTSCGRGEIIGKVGADGVYCVSIPKEGIGVALKIENGDMRIAQMVAANTLKQLGFLDDSQISSLSRYFDTPVLDNRKKIIGVHKAVFNIKK